MLKFTFKKYADTSFSIEFYGVINKVIKINKNRIEFLKFSDWILKYPKIRNFDKNCMILRFFKFIDIVIFKFLFLDSLSNFSTPKM